LVRDFSVIIHLADDLADSPVIVNLDLKLGAGKPAMALPLTIIIPTFGRQSGLEKALASVSWQRGLPERVIVVDDGSKEPIDLGRLQNSRLPIELLRHEENLGAAAARNTGMRVAESAWISFLDSDDYLLEDSLTARWDVLESAMGKGADERTVFGCGWFDVDGHGKIHSLRWPQPGRSPEDFAAGCWFSPGSCVIINRNRALAVGPQDESLRRFEDLEWFLRLSLEGFTYLPARIAGAMVSRRRKVSIEAYAMARLAASQILEKSRDKLSPVLMSRLKAYMALEIGASAFFSGRYAHTALALVQSFAYAPRLRLQLSPGWEFEPPPYPESSANASFYQENQII
jgi:glycosyltransferase involved in cell wall biosynthesis